MKDSNKVTQTTNDVGARLVVNLVTEAVEAFREALTKEPWNHGFTEEQKSGLIRFHRDVFDHSTWKATTVWKEGGDTFGKTVLVEPTKGGLYSVSIEWLGSFWAFSDCPELVAGVSFGDFLRPWLMSSNLMVCSEGWLSDEEQLVISEHFRAKTARHGTMWFNTIP
jgi:hypothetical protein